MPTRCALPFILSLFFALISACPTEGQTPADGIRWQRGPTVAGLGTEATLDVPSHFVFADADGTKKFMELNQNIPSGKELGVLAPDKGDWFVVFSFDWDGYVKDDEKSSLDADAMLKSIQSATENANEERRRRGWGTITVLDWIQPPQYNDSTHNVEWSTRSRDEKGNLLSNYNTRYLGRHGVMRVSLVADADALTSTLPQFRRTMAGFAYKPDTDYRAFVKGDKVAEYGLTALVVGGAAAVAAKGGFLKYLWKLIVAGIVGLGGLLKKIFGRKKQQTSQGI